ncbi:MAG: hypothetical protein H6713_27885 [Myxococcales bacterium]|nr:hypothetical protein [Myxococcales bacterium]MCB9753781.1 hypothetical protein [Myxococcales bacterium]
MSTRSAALLTIPILTVSLLSPVLLSLPACSAAAEQCYEPTLDAAQCDPASVEFSLASTNPYYPLIVGSAVVLEGMDGDEFIRVERVVLPDTEVVAGVETHVLEHKEFVDGELHELARNFYVEAADGTVCYFGEEVDFYEGGELANHDGSWRVGEGDAKPGIIMPAAPAEGQAYFQENAPGQAIDMGRVFAVGKTEMINGQSYDDVLTIMDVNPMDGCDEEEPKRYIPGIGEVDDNGVVLIEYTPGAG